MEYTRLLRPLPQILHRISAPTFQLSRVPRYASSTAQNTGKDWRPVPVSETTIRDAVDDASRASKKRVIPISTDIIPHTVDNVPMINENIPGTHVQLKDENNRLLPPVRLATALESFDHATSFLALLSAPGVQDPPICGIFNKVEELAKFRERKKAQKLNAKVKSTKQIELNWAMAPHDLSHRLGQLKGFLEKGNKVEVLLARKRKGRRATPEEGGAMLAKIRETVKGVDGASVWKEMDGQMLGEATLAFQGKSQPGSRPEAVAEKPAETIEQAS